MAEDYGQGIQYANVETPVIPVDYSFLNFALNKKEAQYEQGANQVKSMYNSILNSPLTNQDNQQVREQYMNEAKSGIQSLSKADLSLPQNVNQASKIFSPFWKDSDIIADVSQTKYIQNQQQQYDAAKNSTDEKVRATVNPYQEKYINMSTQDLQDAQRGNGSIQAVPKRSFTSFKDITSYLDDESKKENLEIDWTSGAIGKDGKETFGPILYEHKNGEKTIGNFTQWAKSKIGPEFNDQFRVMGEVDKRDKVNQFRALGYPKDAANNVVGEEYYNQAKDVITTAINTNHLYTTANNSEIELVKDRIAKHGGTAQDQELLEELMNKQVGFKTTSDELSKRLQSHLDPEYKQAYINNSASIISQHIKEDLLNNWAVGKAMNESTKMIANQAWKNSVDYQVAIGNLKARQSELGESVRHNKADEEQKGIKNIIDAYTAGLDLSKIGSRSLQTPIINENNKLANTSQDLSKVDKTTLATGIQEGLKSSYINATWSDGINPGLSQALVIGKALNTNELSTLNTYMRSVESGNKPQVTPEVTNVISKFHDAMVANNIPVDWTPTKTGDFNAYVKNIRGALQQYADQLSNNKKIKIGADQVSALHDLNQTAQRAQSVLDQNQTQLSNNIKTQLALNPDLYKGATITRNGQLDIKHPNDFVQQLPTKIIGYNEDNNTSELSSSNIAKAYTNGTLQINPTTDPRTQEQYVTLNLNGKTYDIKDENSVNALLHFKYNNIPSTEFKDKTTKLVTNAIPNLDKNGSMGFTVDLPYTDPRAYQVQKAISQPDNFSAIYDETNKPITDDKILGAVQRLTSSTPAIMTKSLANPQVETVSQYGTPAITVQLNSGAKAQIEKNEDEKLLDGKTLHFVINPLTSNKNLRDILQAVPDKPELYPELKKGRSVTLPEFAGTKATISPSLQIENSPAYDINVTSKVIDPNSGNYIDSPVYSRRVDASKFTPDQIVQGAQAYQNAALKQSAVNQNNFRKKSGVMTLQQIEQNIKDKQAQK